MNFDDSDLPQTQYLAPDVVLLEMAHAGAKRATSLAAPRVLVLSLLAGGFITIGALFSVSLGTGIEAEGAKQLLEGFGFSVGFFLVILTGALLFTEVNVELPATILAERRSTGSTNGLAGPILRLWVLAAVGNFLGAFAIGFLIDFAHDLKPESAELLLGVTESKLRYQEVGGVNGWIQAVVSGALGNWLVGMAAFLSVMGRTIIGKFIPVFVIVTAFVTLGFLHSPANMAFFSLHSMTGEPTPWGDAFTWSILPAAVGNVAGAILLVALPFWFASTRNERSQEQS